MDAATTTCDRLRLRPHDSVPLRAFLQASPWASQLRAPTLERLRAATHVRELRPGEVLARQGDVPAHWFGIMSGLLRLDMVCEDGEAVAVTARPAGTWFGEAALLLRQPRTYEVSAMRASRVACMDASAFLQTLKDDAGFNAAVLRALSARVTSFLGLMASHRARDVEARIAGILVSLAPRPPLGRHLQVDVSQDELAQLVGVARQRANRALRTLQARGLIETSYASVTVLDLAGLAEL